VFQLSYLLNANPDESRPTISSTLARGSTDMVIRSSRVFDRLLSTEARVTIIPHRRVIDEANELVYYLCRPCFRKSQERHIKDLILQRLRVRKVMSTTEVAEFLKIRFYTVRRYLDELAAEHRVIRVPLGNRDVTLKTKKGKIKINAPLKIKWMPPPS
jgi:hypothetical protein